MNYKIIIALVLLLLPAVTEANSNTVSLDLITVPAGPFVMGSTPAEREAAYQLDEAAYGHSRTRKWRWYEGETRSTPDLPEYEITKTPVTNSQYRKFLLSTGYRSPDVSKTEWENYGLIHPYKRTRRHAWHGTDFPSMRDDHPVVLVSADDAMAYARWVSLETGQQWRLPTEQEWEKAARGDEGRMFPWGNGFDSLRLNSHDSGPFDTVPVGQYPKGNSPYGLIDAAGQVFEWTSTKAKAQRYIVKGGSWDDRGCGMCRPAARHSRPAYLKHILIGFRLVRVTPQ